MSDLPLSDVAELNEFSRAFANVLFAAYPSWRSLAKYHTEERTLLVEVPSPVDSERLLRVYTDDDEVTIEFDAWHTHVWEGSGDEQLYFQQALLEIDDLIQERSVIQIVKRGDRWGGALFVDPEVPLLYPSLIDFPERPDLGPLTSTYRRSWLGTFDEESVLP